MLFRSDELFRERCCEILKATDIIKVSIEEGELTTGEKEISAINKELHALGAKVVVITLGSKGSSLSVAGKEAHIPSIPVKMVDATGAGDAYIGALLALLTKEVNAKESLVQLETMERIVAIANKVGAKTTENYGAIAAIPTLDRKSVV